MYRRHLVLVFVVLLLIPLALGCGIKDAFFSKGVPPLEDYSTVVLVRFDFGKPSAQYADLPIMVSYGIGTKLGVRYEDRNWLYDQSKEITPVGDKLKELNISAGDTYRDPQAAIKLGESLKADLVIVGQMEKPKFTKEESGKIEEDKSESTPTGSARYYAIHQSVILPAEVKIINVKAAQEIWAGRVVGYKKYKTRYRTGNPQKSQREETMLADVRRELVAVFVEKLYPAAVK